jgi:hypothetical protein
MLALVNQICLKLAVLERNEIMKCFTDAGGSLQQFVFPVLSLWKFCHSD